MKLVKLTNGIDVIQYKDGTQIGFCQGIPIMQSLADGRWITAKGDCLGDKNLYGVLSFFSRYLKGVPKNKIFDVPQWQLAESVEEL